MDTKEKHIRENESSAKREAREHRDEAVNADLIADSLPAKGRNAKRNHTAGINRLWLWFGVLILVFLLLWWLYSVGIFESLLGYFNG